MSNVTVPTIHLNGTSKDILLDQLEVAVRAINDAVKALANAEPNARDYYPQGDEGWLAARRQHAARINAFMTAHAELMAIYESLMDA
jgi:hypothetical protein